MISLSNAITLKNCVHAVKTMLSSLVSKRYKFSLITFACISVAVISGCSDGSPGGGGIGGTGQSLPSGDEGLIIGRVDGFGSIIINDRRFETNTADILVDGDTATLTDLQIGMKVSARVNYDTGIAQSVQYQPTVVGTVENFDSSTSTMLVLGQYVTLMEKTVLDELTTASLTDGTAIEVNGDRDGNNVIIAEYIKLADDTEEFYAVGEVDEASPDIAHVALVSGTLVDFSQLAEESDLSAEAFAETYLTPGTLLRSSASLESLLSNDCSTLAVTEANSINEAEGFDGKRCFIADSVKIIEKAVFTLNDRVEMVGIVSQVRDTSSFVTNDVTVFTDNDTRYFDQFGVPVSNVAVQQNERVLIIGAANSLGRVVADSIVLKDRQ